MRRQAEAYLSVVSVEAERKGRVVMLAERGRGVLDFAAPALQQRSRQHLGPPAMWCELSQDP